MRIANLSNTLSKLTPLVTILFRIEKIDFGLPLIEKSKLFSFSLFLIGLQNFPIYFVRSSFVSFSPTAIAL